MKGFLCVLKPPGMTSSDVVLFVRKRLPKGTKVGHAGTLDPEAAGVLPIMIGKATRLFDYVTDKEKTYIAQWKPGVKTDTQDAFGKVIARGRKEVQLSELESVLPLFIGQIYQKPPMFSAIKRDGKRLYDLARKGQEVELEKRPIAVHRIQVIRRLNDGSYILEVCCGRGTYIRTLCEDIGESIGCLAHMGFLIRKTAGPFDIGRAVTLEEIDAAENLEGFLEPCDLPLQHLPAVTIDQKAEKLVRCGNPIPVSCIHPVPEPDCVVRLYLQKEFCGIGRVKGSQLRFDAMLLE